MVRRTISASALPMKWFDVPAVIFTSASILTSPNGDRMSAVSAWLRVIDIILVLPMTLVLLKMGQERSGERVLGSTVGGVSLFACGMIQYAYGITLRQPSIASAVGRVLVVPRPACLALTGPTPIRNAQDGGSCARPHIRTYAGDPVARRQKVEKENAALMLNFDLLFVSCLALLIRLLV